MRGLDAFCGAGGCSVGYDRAGLTMVGVDLHPQPNYPYLFVQMDALEALRLLLAGEGITASNGRTYYLSDFVFVHASPPCQGETTLKFLHGSKEYPDLIDPTRDLLERTGLPYVIENVPGAGRKLRNPIKLCGSSFGLGANGRQLRRHRLFESNMPLMSLPCQHSGQPVGVYGTGGGGQMTRGYKGTPDEYREAMGIDWASRAEIAQAIPPAFTQFIGEQLMSQFAREAA